MKGNPIIRYCFSIVLFWFCTFGPLLCHPDLQVKNKQIWLREATGDGRCLTSDPFEKTDPCLSPNRRKIAYIQWGKDNSQTIQVIDSTGSKLAGFTVKLGEEEFKSLTALSFIDAEHLGVECHVNPSLSRYLVLDAGSGKATDDYTGYKFTWSPDKKILAHVGHIIHFSDDPAYGHSEFVEFGHKLVYGFDPKETRNSPITHAFVSEFFWSPDSKHLAFVDAISKIAAPNAMMPKSDVTVVVVNRQGKAAALPLGININPRGASFDIKWTAGGELSLSWKENPDGQEKKQHFMLEPVSGKVSRVKN